MTITAAQGTMLVAHINKPLALYDNFPALRVMLRAATALTFLAPRTPTMTTPSPPPQSTSSPL